MTLESRPALLMQHPLLSKTKVTCPLLSTCSADREWSHITSNTIPKMPPVQHRHHPGTPRASPLQLCNQRSVFNEILLTWINVVLILREGCSRHKMWYWFLRCSLVLSSWPFQKMQSISFLSHHRSRHLYKLEIKALLCCLIFISCPFFPVLLSSSCSFSFSSLSFYCLFGSPLSSCSNFCLFPCSPECFLILI